MTKRERVIAVLQAEGSREVPSKSRKYRQFTSDDPNQYYWVGKCGACRYGRTVTGSIPLNM